MLLSAINNIRQEKKEAALSRYLAGRTNNFDVKLLAIDNLSNYNHDLMVKYEVNWKNGLTNFNGEYYLEIDNRRRFDDFKIDTATRKLAYWFDFKDHLVFETELELGADKKISLLPAPLNIERPGYRFNGVYTVSEAALVYRCEIIFLQSELEPSQFGQWNRDIEQLKKFYNQQIVLTTTK